jgi:hypothetical protein
VISQWAIRVPMMPDEIISSWLVRAALTQGCDPLVLTGDVWPKWRIWTQDADRFLDDERFEPLCAVSGIAKEALRASTLYSVASQIAGVSLPEKAVWPWILTLGARNTRRRSGLQYCPACLAEDSTPYYRLQWRFAWHVGCEKHGCSLLDRCHVCDAPVEPHRLLAEDQQVSVCATCKADLRKAIPTSCSAGALTFQRLADQVALHGQEHCLGETIDAHHWFELASFFASLIRRASRSENEILADFLQQLGVELPEGLPVLVGAGIEMLRRHDRQKLLESLHPLMMAGQGQFELALKESGIALQTFCGKGEVLPKLLIEMASALPDKSRIRTSKPARKLTGPRPRHEVMRMMAGLQRKLEMAKR